MKVTASLGEPKQTLTPPLPPCDCPPTHSDTHKVFIYIIFCCSVIIRQSRLHGIPFYYQDSVLFLHCLLNEEKMSSRESGGNLCNSHFCSTFRNNLKPEFFEAPVVCPAPFLSSVGIYVWWSIFNHSRPGISTLKFWETWFGKKKKKNQRLPPYNQDPLGICIWTHKYRRHTIN